MEKRIEQQEGKNVLKKIGNFFLSLVLAIILLGLFVVCNDIIDRFIPLQEQKLIGWLLMILFYLLVMGYIVYLGMRFIIRYCYHRFLSYRRKKRGVTTNG